MWATQLEMPAVNHARKLESMKTEHAGWMKKLDDFELEQKKTVRASKSKKIQAFQRAYNLKLKKLGNIERRAAKLKARTQPTTQSEQTRATIGAKINVTSLAIRLARPPKPENEMERTLKTAGPNLTGASLAFRPTRSANL